MTKLRLNVQWEFLEDCDIIIVKPQFMVEDRGINETST